MNWRLARKKAAAPERIVVPKARVGEFKQWLRASRPAGEPIDR